jgi:hypothetical protein
MRITESRLRRIIKSVIREAYEDDDIYASFPESSYEDDLSVTGDDYEDDYDYDGEEEAEGPFGMTPEEREELYQSRGLSDESYR